MASAEEKTTRTASALIAQPSDSGTSAAALHHVLRIAHGQWRIGGDAIGQRERLGQQRLGRHDPVDEAEGVGPLGVDGVTGHGQFERHRHGQPLGHADQSARPGDEPTLGLGDAEGGVVGGHHQVAREHDLEAAGQRRAVDGRDDRLGEVALGQAAEAAAGPHDVAALTAAEGLEVHAGAERLVAAAGDDDHPAVGVLGQLVHDGGHRLAHGAVDGVARLGPVDGQDLHVARAVRAALRLPWCSLPDAPAAGRAPVRRRGYRRGVRGRESEACRHSRRRRRPPRGPRPRGPWRRRAAPVWCRRR